MNNTHDKLVIEVGGHIYTLNLLPFNDDINIADFLTIDPSNIFAELATMPLILNQIANMRADLDEAVALGKQKLEILEAQLAADFKRKALGSNKVTIADVQSAVIRDVSYQTSKREHIQVQKNRDIIDGFYWAAQAKINSLNKMADKVLPEEFNAELIEKSINNVRIKRFKGNI